MRVLLLVLLGWSAPVPGLAAQEPPSPTIRAARVHVPPQIDGVLDDPAWAEPLATGAWLTYNPLHGDPIPQRTTVWVAHDEGYLYFAFQCDDPEPSGIRTSVTRRDNIWADDWVGLSLDALGTGQLSYHLMVNPSGVQLDLLNTAAGGEDPSPDFVWDSAGRLNEKGYAVEIRLPLQSIRFRGGDDVTMGVLFWRRVSRLGVSVSWPALEPGRWVFDRHAALHFERLAPLLTREVIPSVTYSSVQSRLTPTRWGAVDRKADAGLSAKIGLTPTITLDATVNPDFSQVESDAFQVEVNQRFPVFFSEKRPFFMEGAGLFELAGSGNDSSMVAAVHTRRIVDPVAGVKVTGGIGRLQFGTLTALDGAAGRAFEGRPDLAGRDRLFNVVRAQYAIGAGSYVGGIATDTEFADSFNRVAGLDLSWRITSRQRMTATALYSRSRDVASADSRSGFGGTAGWSHQSRRHAVAAFVEHYDEGFRMETAFYNRVGITSGWAFGEWNLYPRGRYRWIRRVSPFAFTQRGEDRVAGGSDAIVVAGVRANFTRQGSLRIDHVRGHEPWQGQRYPIDRPRIMGEVQVFRWLRVAGRLDAGPAVFYDPEAPYQGRSRNQSLDISWQPTPRLNQGAGYRRVEFDRADTGARVYTLDLLNTRTTLQFTRQLFVRGIIQYDSLRTRVLSDLLASFELRPGTVAYAGYGSLHERRGVEGDERLIPEIGPYQLTRRGFFLKASYLHRF